MPRHLCSAVQKPPAGHKTRRRKEKQAMRRFHALLFSVAFLLLLPGSAHGEVRALLVACRAFLSAPSLGYDSSANLQILAACLTLSGVDGTRIRLEDGTISSPAALKEAARQNFSDAGEEDACLLYLCTHGYPDPYLLLSDGLSEGKLTPRELHALLSPLPGQKLLILDACSSGAFLDGPDNPLAADPAITVLTSCGAGENSWASAGNHLSPGILSYFVHALCAGLGLYAGVDADADGNGEIAPAEILAHLRDACVFSTPRLSPASAASPALPAVVSPLPERALTGFSFGPQLLSPEDPEILLSCTVRRDAAVQYRLIEYRDGEWDWPGAVLVSGGQAETGRLSQSIRLRGAEAGDYFALQVYSLEEGFASLCASRLFAVRGAWPDSSGCSRETPAARADSSGGILRIYLPGPALLTCELVSPSGETLSVLCRSHLFLPDRNGFVTLFPGEEAFSSPGDRPVWRIAADAGEGRRVLLRERQW